MALHTPFFHPIERRAKADRFKDRRRPRLEPVWRIVVCHRFRRHEIDHLAAALERWQSVERFALAVKNANAGWPIKLVACHDVEVAIDGPEHRLFECTAP